MTNLYLGKRYNLLDNETRSERLEYNLDNLTTHAVVVGMTGSGKTGLGLTLIEELALQSLPVIMIDPKGDLTNSLLHFPEMDGKDFASWVNESSASRNGLTKDQFGEQVAKEWRDGLGKWEITKQDIERLNRSADYSVYTPGSDAGLQISVLASLSAPDLSWEDEAEILQQRISGTVTALLGLVGYENVDPINSEEHILICNIIESLWRSGKDITLEDLIMYVVNPPFDKLGVFHVEDFFPTKNRQRLAHKINNFLASPSFGNWIEGEPLDIERIFYTEDGKPRHSVFYIAHLEEKERMFFVTLLYTAIESWMRKTKGSSGLRALVYFDEITGYLPPISNPPSKSVILRMLKHARAYGIGMILASQNPVDLDYKALSNAGTWFVGKLQTEQDRRRLVSGIENSSMVTNRKVLNEIISSLSTRVFMMHSIYEQAPTVFRSRWAMNYLAGPITLEKIPALNNLAGARASKIISQPKKLSNSECQSKASSIGYHYLSADVSPKEALRRAGLPPTKQYPYEIYKGEPAKDNSLTTKTSFLAKKNKRLVVPRYAPIEITDDIREHGVLWKPYYGFIINGKIVLLPAFEKGE